MPKHTETSIWVVCRQAAHSTLLNAVLVLGCAPFIAFFAECPILAASLSLRLEWEPTRIDEPTRLTHQIRKSVTICSQREQMKIAPDEIRGKAYTTKPAVL